MNIMILQLRKYFCKIDRLTESVDGREATEPSVELEGVAVIGKFFWIQFL